MREIEDAAKHKRAADEAALQRQALADEARPGRLEKARLSTRRDVFAQSLGGGQRVQTVLITLSLLVPVGAIGLVAASSSLTGWVEYGVILIGSVLALVMMFTVPDFIQGSIARLRFGRFVRSVPWLDRDAYREAMCENRGPSTLIVRVEFQGSWKTKKDDVADAVMTWAPLKSVEWAGDALVLTSEPLITKETVSGRGSFYSLFTNRNIHRCFARIVHQVLPKLSAVTPVREITWRIDGTIEPWNARTSLV